MSPKIHLLTGSWIVYYEHWVCPIRCLCVKLHFLCPLCAVLTCGKLHWQLFPLFPSLSLSRTHSFYPVVTLRHLAIANKLTLSLLAGSFRPLRRRGRQARLCTPGSIHITGSHWVGFLGVCSAVFGLLPALSHNVSSTWDFLDRREQPGVIFKQNSVCAVNTRQTHRIVKHYLYQQSRHTHKDL